jgi:hypothetical protein
MLEPLERRVDPARGEMSTMASLSETPRLPPLVVPTVERLAREELSRV